MPKIKRADIIKSEYVINMAMSYQDCVQVINPAAKRLLPKIARGVNQNSFARMLDKYRYPKSLIPWIIRKARSALATN